MGKDRTRDRRSGFRADALCRLLAIIPSLFGFIGACLIGVIANNGTTLRAPIVDGLFGAIFGYVMACATVLVSRCSSSLLAPIFGGRRGFDSAFKLAVYSFTPVWLAGIFLLLPGLHFLALFGCYGLYILWLGAPRLAKVPERNVTDFRHRYRRWRGRCSSMSRRQCNTRYSARRGFDFVMPTSAISVSTVRKDPGIARHKAGQTLRRPTTCLHAGGRPASVIGGFGFAGMGGGAGMQGRIP